MLSFEGWPATDLETRLVRVAVEGNGVIFDFEAASQFFPNFFYALLDHRSIFSC